MSSYEKKRLAAQIVTLSLLCISFAIGQALLYAFYSTKGTVFALTKLVETANATSFNTIAFISVTTAISAVSCILICVDVNRYAKSRKYLFAWLFTIPTYFAFIIIPSLTACLLFVFGFVLIFVKKKKAVKALLVIYSLLIAATIIVFPSVAEGVSHSTDPATIQIYNLTYTRNDDGKYYVTDYSGEENLVVIPTVINDKYEVGGVSTEFKQVQTCYVFSLNYEHATANNDAIQVVVFNIKTKEKYPIPKREGYTFYGWWSTNNRNTGKQLIDKDGNLVTNDVNKEQRFYAMWYGTDYTFISKHTDFNLNNYGKYVLTNDIEMPNSYTPIGGLSGMEIQSNRSAFNGIFDGNYHTIKYSINGSRRYSGLFSWLGPQGLVTNLGVNVNITVEFKPTDAMYYAFAGGIAAINDGTIVNCWSEGKICLKSATSVAFSGGIAGASGTENMRTGEIKECFNLAQIETVADDAYAGGILGSAENNYHLVSYCYNRGSIKATGRNSNNTAAGGIISHGRTYAKHCFNAGAILTDYSDKQSIGGIIGFTRNTSSHGNFPSDCVWLKAKNCQAEWGIGTYPNDKSGGNNKGVTVVSKEDEKALGILNGGTNKFILKSGHIHLAWEQ